MSGGSPDPATSQKIFNGWILLNTLPNSFEDKRIRTSVSQASGSGDPLPAPHIFIKKAIRRGGWLFL